MNSTHYANDSAEPSFCNAGHTAATLLSDWADPGEWLTEKHGAKRRRAWRVLHLATDADTGRIVASVLTDKDADDGSQVGPLLDRIEARLLIEQAASRESLANPRALDPFVAMAAGST